MKRWLLLGLLAAGCGSSEHGVSVSDSGVFEPPECASASPTECPDDPRFACPESSGYGGIVAIDSHDVSDTEDVASTEATIHIPAPRTLCYRGTLAANLNQDSYAELNLALDQRGDQGKCVYAVFDAVALGVSAIEFTLADVPLVPLYLTARSIVSGECEDAAFCVGESYVWLTPDREEIVELTAGTHRARLADLIGSDSLMPIDRRRISLFSLRLFGIERPVDFDFCVYAVRFLDEAGREVDIPPR